MNSQTPTITLLSLGDTPPSDAEGMLLELGAGENGFAGTSVGMGEATLLEYVEACRAQSRGENIREGWVPSTTYWILADGKSAGLLRLRHYLNTELRHKGGHIGYYVRPAYRGKGAAKQALALALPHAKALGETRVMLTTNPDNLGSIKVIEANGGALLARVIGDKAHGDSAPPAIILQYWIDT